MALTPSERKIIAPTLEVPELGRDPASLPFLRQVNDLVTTLAHLVAVYAGKSVLLKADVDGKLMVNAGTAGASTTIPFWAATAPDVRLELLPDGVGGKAHHDYGSAAPRRIAYVLSSGAEHRYAFLFDSDTDVGVDRMLLPPMWETTGSAYTTGQFLVGLSQEVGTASIIVLSWDL